MRVVEWCTATELVTRCIQVMRNSGCDEVIHINKHFNCICAGRLCDREIILIENQKGFQVVGGHRKACSVEYWQLN